MKTYQIEIKEKEDYKKKGNSRIGGLPDLPLEIKYPIGEDRPWEFLAQINFQEIEDENSILPKKGILYIFIKSEFEGRFFHVEYSSNTEELETQTYPESALKYKYFYQHTGRKIAFRPLTGDKGKHTVLKDSEWDADPSYLWLNGYRNLRNEIFFFENRPVYFHSNGENPFAEDVNLLINRDEKGELIGTKEEIEFQKSLLKFDKEREFHHENRKKMRCLLSFRDIDECEFSWGSLWNLQFFMMEEDIRRAKFSTDTISIFFSR